MQTNDDSTGKFSLIKLRQGCEQLEKDITKRLAGASALDLKGISLYEDILCSLLHHSLRGVNQALAWTLAVYLAQVGADFGVGVGAGAIVLLPTTNSLFSLAGYV